MLKYLRLFLLAYLMTNQAYAASFFQDLVRPNTFVYAKINSGWQPDIHELYAALKATYKHQGVAVAPALLKHASGVSDANHVWQFKDESLNANFSRIFDAIAHAKSQLGFSVELSQYDLFHGHIFAVKQGGKLTDISILFHAKEYPRDLKLGYPEAEKNSPFSTRSWEFPYRDFIWLASTGLIYDLDSYSADIYPKYFLPDGMDANDPNMQDVVQKMLQARTFLLEDLHPKIERLGDVNEFVVNDQRLIFFTYKK